MIDFRKVVEDQINDKIEKEQQERYETMAKTLFLKGKGELVLRLQARGIIPKSERAFDMTPEKFASFIKTDKDLIIAKSMVR